jgi:ATP-dependent DNA ligase
VAAEAHKLGPAQLKGNCLRSVSHEIKFDGYRMHARLDRDAVRLLTRTGLDWTLKYPSIAVGRTTRHSEYHVLSAATQARPARCRPAA